MAQYMEEDMVSDSEEEAGLELSFTCSFSEDGSEERDEYQEGEEIGLVAVARQITNIQPYSKKPRAKPKSTSSASPQQHEPAFVLDDQSWRLHS